MQAVKDFLSRSFAPAVDEGESQTETTGEKAVAISRTAVSTTPSKHAHQAIAAPNPAPPGLAARIQRVSENRRSSQQERRGTDQTMVGPFSNRFKITNTLNNTLQGRQRLDDRPSARQPRPAAIPRSLPIQSSEGSNTRRPQRESPRQESPQRESSLPTDLRRTTSRQESSRQQSPEYATQGCKRRRIFDLVDLTSVPLDHEKIVAVNGNSTVTGFVPDEDLRDADPFRMSQQSLARPLVKKRRKSKENSLSLVVQDHSTSPRTTPATLEKLSYGRKRAAPPPKFRSLADQLHDDVSDSDDVLHGNTTVLGSKHEKPEPDQHVWLLREFHMGNHSLLFKAQASNASLALRFEYETNRFVVMQSGGVYVPPSAPEALSFGPEAIRNVYYCRTNGMVSFQSPSGTFILLCLSEPAQALEAVDIAVSITAANMHNLAPERMKDHWAGTWRKIQQNRLREAQPVQRSLIPKAPPIRRSTRKSDVINIREVSPLLEKWTQTHGEKIRTQFKYPVVFPSTGPRQVTIPPHDLERLDEGEFLNDDLIGYALRSIEEDMNSADRQRVHFFNSFFYSSLTDVGPRAKINYDKVRRWTRNEDLFRRSFVVVPINQNLHWYAAIICNLSALCDGKVEIGQQSDPVSVSDSPTADVFTFGEDMHIAADQPVNTSAPKRPAGQRKFDPKGPVIITLDSFGSTHAGEIRNLKEYVIAEAKDKKSVQIDITDIKGITAKGIPEQSNFCDCGLYLIGYIRQFAKDPQGFVRKIVERNDAALAEDFQSFDSSNERKRIRNELFELSKQQMAERAARRKQAVGSKVPSDKALQIPAAPLKQLAPPEQHVPEEHVPSPTKAVHSKHEDHTMDDSGELRLGDTVPDSQEAVS